MPTVQVQAHQAQARASSPSKAFTRLSLLLAGAGLAAAAWAAEPAPKDTTAINPLGGKSAAPAAAKPAAVQAGQARQITWEELVPKDWDPAKEFKGMDLSALDDGDPKANELLMKMQEVSNNAPTNPSMNGVEVKIPGFIVPLEEAKGEVTEFLLVPYFGACIHTPPPPANQILHVVPQKGAKFRAMDTVWVTGKLQTLRNDSMMGVSGYHVSAANVTKYTGGSK
jgi:hypothetical protein